MIRALKMIAERIAAVGRVQIEDVERVELRVGGDEDRRDDGEVLGQVVGDRERRQRAARDQQLLADLDDVEQLRRVGVEVDHVAGLLGGRRAGVHGDADVGLGQRGRVVRAVARHRDELAALLLLADQRELGLGRGLGEVVVDARLGGDRGRRERVVARDHHGADAGRAHLRRSASRMPSLTMSLSSTTPSTRAPSDDHERRGAPARDAVDDSVELARDRAAALLDEAPHGVGRRPCAARGRRCRRRSCASRP